MRWPNLVNTLSGLNWAVVGAVATRMYMPATRDLDILILPSEATAVADRLESAGYRRQGSLTIGGSAWLAPDGTPLDVVEGREAWCPEALAEAAANLDELSTPVLTAPFLVLMKLYAGRVQDVADVTRILGGLSDSDIDLVRAVIMR